MRLCEDLQEETIAKFQEILDSYNIFWRTCSDFEEICKENDNLKFESNYLFDFCKEEINNKLKNTQDAILDEFYPIDYADEEEDPVKAGDRYQNSKEIRDNIFKW